MEYLLFIQRYYIYLILLFFVIVPMSFFLYNKKSKRIGFVVINFFVILFAGWTVYILGNRGVNIGIDTSRYYYAFNFYNSASHFVIRKDIFFDLLTYIIAHFSDFTLLLIFCGFVYVFGTFYGLKKIFSRYYYIPFLLFLISPNFIDFGINVMRSGMAGAVFLIGLGLYYNESKLWKVYLLFILSVLFHISLIVPLLFFTITNYVKNTKILFFCWLGSIMLYILNINIMSSVVNRLDSIGILNSFTNRAEIYASAQGDFNSWYHFVIFGLLPIGFAVFNILFLKYKNKFYIRLTNIYILIYIPYTILMSTRFAYRIGYLAEFMMPVILLFPFFIETKIKMKYPQLKLCFFIFVLFLLKAYKILLL